MPDGSRVILNANSRLRYQKHGINENPGRFTWKEKLFLPCKNILRIFTRNFW
ncbi:MAG: FecR domain-containing protein, partial [Bacteroidia bacterium]|nr:FecR domain-containing protein [Bacteroidia bacterium]